MKKLNYIITGLAFLSIVFISACGSEESTSNDTDTTTTQKLEEKMDVIEAVENDSSTTSTEEITEPGVEYTAKYVCPNRCKGSGSDKPGECSNTDCGMELMENPNSEK